MNDVTDILSRPRKRFAHWLWIKRDIEDSEHKPPLFKEGEVWWCHAGENVGVEINGKGETFTRPFLVFKKYDQYSFLALPLSTVVKTGSWYATINFNDTAQCVNLAQGRVLDYKRLKEKMGQVNVEEFKIIDRGYIELHFLSIENRPPAISGGSRGQIPNVPKL